MAPANGVDPAEFPDLSADIGDTEMRLHSPEAERKTLACIMVRNEILPRVFAIVDETDVSDPKHVTILRSMRRLGERCMPIEPYTLKEDLLSSGELAAIGGEVYLAGLLDAVTSAQHFAEYARAVKRARALRDLEALPGKARNGHSPAHILSLIEQARSAWVKGTGRGMASAVSLFDVPAKTPEFTVSSLIRRGGLHLVWGEPSAGKTWFLLRWMFELLLTEPPSHLSGHPDLAVSGNYTRVLWIGTEEETGILRSKADMVVRGLGTTDGPASVAGTFLHRWAPEPGQRLTLDDLPDLLESDGPLDAVVLDSLTGLRPKVRDGRRVAWDLDNDMTNELCLQLRGLAKQHDVDLFLVHHTGRDTGKGYRGPTEWWASADVQVGLIPDGPDRVRVKPEKNRDGRLLKPFYLSREWGPDGFRVSYEGAATQSATLSPSAAKADAFLRGKGRASQRQIAEGAGLSVKTVQRAARDCVEAGLWTDTGETDLRSVVYQHKGGSVDDAA